MKLWGDKWNINAEIESFETKDDLIIDQELAPYDVLGSLAHAQILLQQSIITKIEHAKIRKGLKEIFHLAKQGKLRLNLGDEDIHTKIESYLTEKYGEVGKKIHTGRSRNDQVLTALRLLIKDRLLSVEKEMLSLSNNFIEFAKRYQFMPMPGYTHMQKAMPSSVGMWSASFAEALLDDLQVIQTAYRLSDQSPLGSAAGYGVPIALDRKLSAKLLGFAKIQNNSLYCQNSRGKIEAVVIIALVTILSDINRFANDILLFTMSEFSFFSASPELYTGSSLMPQKKNLDVAELLASKVKRVLGNYVTVVTTPLNLLSGYNRSLQDIKKPLLESLNTVLDCIKTATLLLANLTPNEENLTKAITPEMFAAHSVFQQVQKGSSFREAYQQISKNLNTVVLQDLPIVLRNSKNEGSTGNLGLRKLSTQLQKEVRATGKKRRDLDMQWSKLLN